MLMAKRPRRKKGVHINPNMIKVNRWAIKFRVAWFKTNIPVYLNCCFVLSVPSCFRFHFHTTDNSLTMDSTITVIATTQNPSNEREVSLRSGGSEERVRVEETVDRAHRYRFFFISVSSFVRC